MDLFMTLATILSAYALGFIGGYFAGRLRAGGGA